MDLKDYIENSLYSIIYAVNEVQEKVSESGVIVFPSTIKDGNLDDFGKQKLMNVKFDVAVTVGDSKENKKGVAIKVVEFISGEIKASTTTNNQSISRIAFEVPIAMPVLDKLTEEARKRKNDNLRNIANML
ncbi:hypothetical protein [Chryseobacterium sp. WLY505]|uniref:hypothetical protein n=1 Tax=Chryseobacterium sp. WLY505 TaxID=3068892 RepID=UPI002796A57C|nr:hypothetical protein [Chryseobacterium sp. WLY505]MDQ1859263.1 hypothetical protein [Chryseobacterium sp. WLY505]